MKKSMKKRISASNIAMLIRGAMGIKEDGATPRPDEPMPRHAQHTIASMDKILKQSLQERTLEAIDYKHDPMAYMRHLVGEDAVKRFHSEPMVVIPSASASLANVMRAGIRDAETAMMREAGCEFMPGMIIMAPSPEQIRAREAERQIHGPMGLEPSAIFQRSIDVEPIKHVTGFDPISLKILKDLMEKETKFKLRPYQVAVVEAMKKHKGPIVYDMLGMGYRGIQPRRFGLDKIYGKSPTSIIVDEVHEPVTTFPKKEST